MKFMISADWESKSSSRAISRWFCILSPLAEDKYAGYIAGYSGGGCFEVEKIYCHLEGKNVHALWCDMTDRISGEEIDFDELSSETQDAFDGARAELWKWNDNDIWCEEDQLLLIESNRNETDEEDGLLHFQSAGMTYSDLIAVREICELAGLTAGPAV